MQITERSSGAVMSAPLQSLAQGAMFWRPDHIEPSPWLDHLPWIFWLMEALSPQRCVTLGARTGSPHTAFCQGVSRLNLDAECVLAAEDEDDEAESIHEAADRRYGAIARRLNVLPRRGARQVPAGSVDILALDFAPDDPEFDDTLDRWLSRMSDRGIVLIPGINRREPGCAAYEHFEALQDTYPSLTFLHGDGLGILVVGSRPTSLIETLLERWSEPTAARTVRDVFARLGRGCADQALANVQRARLKGMKQRLDELTRERDERDSSLTDLRRQIQEREEHLASLESEKQALSDSYTESQRRQEHAESASAEAQARLASVESALRISESQVNALELELAEHKENIQTRFSELAKLTALAEEKDAALEKLKLSVTELESRISGYEHELTAAQGSLSEAEQRRNVLEAENTELKTSARASESALERELISIRASLAEAEQRRDALESENAALKTAEKKVVSTDTASTEAIARMRDLEAMLHERDESIAARFKELAILTQTLEERDREISSLKGETDSSSLSLSDTGDRSDIARESIAVQAQSGTGAEAATSRWGLGRFSLGGEHDTRKEKRRLRRKRQEALAELEASDWFDAQWYLAQNPDIASDESYARFPALHYLKFGGFEGRDPSPHFDSAGYLDAYPDVAMTEINPLLHFIRNGIKEGREPRP